MLTEPDALSVVVTAAQGKLQMTRHSGWSVSSFAELTWAVFELFIITTGQCNKLRVSLLLNGTSMQLLRFSV